MAKQCKICGIHTIFFNWSSSRWFNRHKVVAIYKGVTDFEKRALMKDSYPVCFACCEKFKIMERPICKSEFNAIQWGKGAEFIRTLKGSKDI